MNETTWTTEKRRAEVEERIISDIEFCLQMPFYDQDKERGEKYRALLKDALGLYAPEHKLLK